MRFTLEKRPEGTLVRLDGALDEAISDVLENVALAACGARNLIFDVSAVNRIVSVGIKDWIAGFDKLDKLFTCSFEGCTMAFLDAAMMVPAVINGRAVHSILALYSCVGCFYEETVVVAVTGRSVALVVGRVCSRCGDQMAADDELMGDLEMVLSP